MRLQPILFRLVPLFALCALGSGLIACVDREPLGAEDPHSIISEEIVTHVTPPSRATSRTVRCACDADGALHIQAPQGSTVGVPEDATQPSEAEVVLPEDKPLPLRRSKSLGFIGDGKLTEIPSYGGSWNVPDGLLPPHQHGGFGGTSRYGTSRYGGTGYRSSYSYSNGSASPNARGWR